MLEDFDKRWSQIWLSVEHRENKIFARRANCVDLDTVSFVSIPVIGGLLKHYEFVKWVSRHRIYERLLLENHVEQYNTSIEHINVLAEVALQLVWFF